MPRRPQHRGPDDDSEPSGCGPRLLALFAGVSAVILGVVTVVTPSTGRARRPDLIWEFLFKTHVGGVVLILIGCTILFFGVRRK